MTHPLRMLHNLQKHQIYFCQYPEPHIAVHLRPHTEALLFFPLGPKWMGRLPMPETSPSFVRRESLAKNRSVFNQNLAGFQQTPCQGCTSQRDGCECTRRGLRLENKAEEKKMQTAEGGGESWGLIKFGVRERKRKRGNLRREW